METLQAYLPLVAEEIQATQWILEILYKLDLILMSQLLVMGLQWSMFFRRKTKWTKNPLLIC